LTYDDSSFNTGVLQSPNYPARFFIDDVAVPNEHSAGAVARIRVFDTALSAAEVAALEGVDLSPPTSKPDAPGAKRATATQVHCNYLVATGVDTCTAQVGDAGPA